VLARAQNSIRRGDRRRDGFDPRHRADGTEALPELRDAGRLRQGAGFGRSVRRDDHDLAPLIGQPDVDDLPVGDPDRRPLVPGGGVERPLDARLEVEHVDVCRRWRSLLVGDPGTVRRPGHDRFPSVVVGQPLRRPPVDRGEEDIRANVIDAGSRPVALEHDPVPARGPGGIAGGGDQAVGERSQGLRFHVEQEHPVIVLSVRVEQARAEQQHPAVRRPGVQVVVRRPAVAVRHGGDPFPGSGIEDLDVGPVPGRNPDRFEATVG